MDSLLDTFLHYEQFQHVYTRVQTYLTELTSLTRDKRIKRIRNVFQYQKTFNTDSVQGMAGIVNIDTGIAIKDLDDIKTNLEDDDTINQPIVFKLSVEMNRSVEHEYHVLNKLNALRKYCPNFVATLGLLNGFVCRSFFEAKEPTSIKNVFEVKQNAVQTNYLLIEYVSDITFKHICKYADKSTVTGTILSVLCALQIAQNKLQFTHYDLHSDNILMRRVEEDSYFAYVINGKVVLYPTGGWYPVMIDMGSSYIQGTEDKPNRTSISHYHRGLQSTEFDVLGDVHHFVLSALSRLEKADETQSEDFCRHFRTMAGHLMHMFRAANIWRHKGWKQLPYNIIFLFNEAVLKAKPQTCNFYAELQTSVVETLALGVKLPWQPLTQDELSKLLAYYYPQQSSHQAADLLPLLIKLCIEDVCHFLSVLDEDPLTKSDIIVMYTLRALVEHASMIKELSTPTFVLPKEVLTAFKQITHTMYPHYSYKLDFNRSFRGCSCLFLIMRHMLYVFNQPNVKLMKEWYNQIDVKSGLEVAQFIQQNTAIRYDWRPTSVLYIWDSDHERQVQTTFGSLGVISEDVEGCKKAILHLKR